MSQADNVIASAKVIIGADTTGYDKATRGLAGNIIAAEQTVRAEIAKTSVAMKEATSAFKAGNQAAGSAVAFLAEQQDKLRGKLEATAVAARRLASANQGGGQGGPSGQGGNSQGGGNGRRGSNRLQSFARIADDIQYVGQNGQGLRPIINNLVEVHPLLGLTALAADLLARNWDTVKATMGENSWLTRLVAGLQQGVDSLNIFKNATEKAIDAAEAASSKARAEATEEVAGIQDAGAAGRGSAVTGAVQAAGGGTEVVNGMVARFMKGGAKVDKEGMERLRGQYAVTIQKAMNGDKDAIAQLKQLGGPDLAKAIDAYSPAAVSARNASMQSAETALGDRYTMGILKGGFGGKTDKVGVAEVEGRVRRDLVRSGRSEAEAKDMAGKLAETLVSDVEEKVKAKALAKGVDAQTARAMVAQDTVDEMKERLKKERAAELKRLGKDLKPEVLSIDQYFNRLQTGGLKEDADSKELIKANQTLRQINEGVRDLRVARFG